MHRSNEQTIDRRLDEAGSTGCRQPCCGSGDTGMRKGHAATAIRDSHRGADRGAEGLARADLEIDIGRLVRKGGLSESRVRPRHAASPSLENPSLATSCDMV